jgi:polysaccharide export outer membrane protein
MGNRQKFLGLRLSVSSAIALGTTLLPLPAVAQIPTFDGTTEPLPVVPETGGQSPSGIEDAAVVSSSYVLGPGDEIQLDVYDYEEFQLKKVILPDGTITLPLIGRMMAANRTVPELTQALERRLQEWLVEPDVTINILQLRPLVINVAGEVQRPGPIQLSRETLFSTNNITSDFFVRSPTVNGALQAAGGVTRNADIRQVVLKRHNPGGKDPVVTINLWDSLTTPNAPRDLILQDGDSIFVPRLQEGETLDQRLLARSSYAPETVRVRVVGEVKKPGELEVPPNSSLSSAVAIAGGPTDDAKLSNVRYVRLQENGTIEERSVDLSNLNDTYQVQDGDVIFVPKTNTGTFLDRAGRAIPPLNFLLNIFRIFD